MEPDRIIIVSHPGADRSISAEGLKEFRVYSRRYRNRRIGEFLKEMHLTEGRNTGFRKIRNALRNNGSPEPLFETDDGRTYFSTTIYIHPNFEQFQVGETINEAINLTEIESRIREYVLSHPTATISEVVTELSINKSAVDRAVRTLKDKGFLIRQGSNKRRIWKIIK